METYGETLAGGSFWHSLGNDFKKAGHWMGNHLGEIGVGALVGAQFIPGVDAVVDLGTAGVESAEAGEGAEEAASSARDPAPKGKKWANPLRRRIRSGMVKGGVGASVGGPIIGGITDAVDPPKPPPPPDLGPGGGPPPNLVGQYSAQSGNPYLN